MMQATARTETIQIKAILVPVDGSEAAAKAARVAVDLALKFGSRIIVASAVSPPSYALATAGSPPGDLSSYYEKSSEEARHAVDATVRLAKDAGVVSQGEVLQAATSTVEAIVELASKE